MKPASPPLEKLLADILDLYQNLLIPFMKIRRDIPFPTEAGRPKTDAEHTFMLIMVALTVADRLQLLLDRGLIAQYALVHDLVEAHAGDVPAKSTDEEQLVKVDREHEAYMVIKERFEQAAPWIPRLIEAYEARADEESKFVYAMDKQMGSFTFMSGGGAGWLESFPEDNEAEYRRVVARLRQKASLYPPLLDLFDVTHEELNKRRPDYTQRTKNE